MDVPIKLCSWQRKCLACFGSGNVQERAYTPETAVVTCSDCNGTGMVYVLDDSVRVPCPLFYSDSHQHGYGGMSYISGSCPFWTPSTDLAVWEQAIFKAWPHGLIQIEAMATWFTPVYSKDNQRLGPGGFKDVGVGLTALQSCLAQVLEREVANA